MQYALHVFTMACLYLMLALSLNVIMGYVGLLSLCQTGFYAIGAYVTTLLLVKVHLSFFVALPVSVIVAVLLSLVVGLPSLRLRGDYFVLASLGFQMIIYTVIYNWEALTGGPYGIPAIPRPALFGAQVASPWAFACLTFAITLAFLAALGLVVRSPFGRALRAIREDEVAAASIGKNVPRTKATAFALAAGLAAVPGALFAVYVSYIDPASFGLSEALLIVAVVAVGGTGNLIGPVVGSLLVTLIPEALRFLHLPDMVAANVRQIVYGLLLILLMRLRPQGIMGDYRLG